MRTFVTAWTQDTAVLRDCLSLLDRYYPLEVTTDVAEAQEPKSNQLMRLLSSLDDEYLILMEGDFFLTREVNRSVLFRIEEFCKLHKADRFSLQSRFAHQIPSWTQTELRLGDSIVYRTNPDIRISFSLEASIWRREFLLDHLEPGCTDAQIENLVSDRIRNQEVGIYALDQPTIVYCDAVRGGKQVIHIQEYPLRLHSEDPIALHPLGPNNLILS